MALYYYKCNLCDNEISKIIENIKDVVGVMPCGACGGFLERRLAPPSSSSSEFIDAGNLTKPVYYDSARHKMARQQGDKLLQDQKSKEKLNEEKK